MYRKPQLSDTPHFGHACLKLNLVLISLLTDRRATQNLKNYSNFFGHVDILWTYQGSKIKMLILALLWRFKSILFLQNIITKVDWLSLFDL